MATGIATQHAPSFRLVQAHFGLGLAGMAAFSAALVWRASAIEGHFFQPTLLGLVHLAVLGWLLPIAIGALHQLIPVVFEVPVRSERLAWAALAVYVPGAIGFLGHMWAYATGAGLVGSAALLVAALYLYIGNLTATLWRAPSVSLTGAYVIAAFGYLLLAATLGFALAYNLHAPYLAGDHLRALRAHAHAAALGFFGLLVMGVAYRLLEMFLLAFVAELRPGWVALVAVNLALACLVVDFLFGHVRVLTIAGSASAAIGIAAFFVQITLLYRARTRRRTDTAWRHSFAAFGYLARALGVGGTLANATPPWEERLVLAYGLLAIPGFIGSVVVGQLYKIVPFLVWFHRFSAYVGLKKVPAASELLPERPQRIQWALMHAGLAVLAAGVLGASAPLRTAGAAAFAASAALFARNMWVIQGRRP